MVVWQRHSPIFISVCRRTENTNWTVSLSNAWIYKNGYAHKHYVVKGLWWYKNLNFFGVSGDEAVDHEGHPLMLGKKICGLSHRNGADAANPVVILKHKVL